MINLKKYDKPIIAVILAATLLSTVYVGLSFAFISGQSPNSNKADYVVFQGNAATDSYDSRQYSYDVNAWATGSIAGTPAPTGFGAYPALNPANVWFNAGKSLRLGMTDYGEFCTPGGVNSGIAYGANPAEWANTESWSSSAINPQYYIQGWEFYMNYTRVAAPRALVAYAIFSNTSGVENGRAVYSWVGDRAPNAVGAQLTSGSLVTSGVAVLYDSARLAIGRTTVVILDGAFANEAVAQVTFTVVFNKDTKYAIIYKDVKVLLDTKILNNILDIGFSERYEIDLARLINPSNQAFIHYYSGFGTTVYQHPLTGQSTFDVLQAFNPNRNYTYFAGYWPSATEYTVYNPTIIPQVPSGITGLLAPGSVMGDIPTPTSTPQSGPGEPNTPWVIAQWRYNSTMWPHMLNFLAKDPNREIRFVEVAGMTDYNTYGAANGLAATSAFRAQDVNAGDSANVVDTEVQYMLNQVFNPVDTLTNTVYNQPNFQWTGVGQASQAVDSAGASQIQGIRTNASLIYTDFQNAVPLGLLDKAEPARGSVPYGLAYSNNYTGSIETFSNLGYSRGTDPTSYMRTGLNGFAFNYSSGSDPEPIAGGMSLLPGWWYPSIDPLTQRWSTVTGATFTLSPYPSNINYHPNGIISIGGPKANWISRYFNDFDFAITREGTTAYALENGGVVTGSAPTSNPTMLTLDFFPVSTWNTATSGSPLLTPWYSNTALTAGYAVISVARDVNGTRGLSVYGWDGRDTYWASAWAAMYLNGNETQLHAWLPAGTVSMVLQINYSNANSEPTGFTVVKALGTITEFGTDRFATAYGFDLTTSWTGNVVPLVFVGGDWWYAKLPTTSSALVDFDS